MDNDFQPIVGHGFNFRSTPMPNWNGIIDCEVLAVEPNKKLSYSWNSMGLESVVSWTLVATSDGTLVRMEQSGFRPDQQAAIKARTTAGRSSWAAWSGLSLHFLELQDRSVSQNSRAKLPIHPPSGSAKHLGARRVVATARNVEALKSVVAPGADAIIAFGEDGEALDGALKQPFAEGVDVVIDYLWGRSAERLLTAAAEGRERRVVLVRVRSDGKRHRKRFGRGALAEHRRA
jgi:hypothetical protein